MNKKIGVGTLSFILLIVGLVWGFTWNHSFCLGDFVLNAIGLKSWSNGNSGTHYAVLYSLFFLVPSAVIGIKFPDSRLAKFGKSGSIVLACFIVLSSFVMIN